MRTEDEIDTRARPVRLVRRSVVALVHAFSAVGLPTRAHVEKVDEEIVRQGSRLFSEDAVFGSSSIRPQHSQTTDQCCHLWCRQGQQLCAIYQCLFRRHELLASVIVAKTV